MAFITPVVADIRDMLLRDIKNQLTDADVGPDSDYFIRASAVASVAEGLYQHQGWIVRQIFPDTADTDYLVLHARTRGLLRKPATTASGYADITGTANAKLPAGSQIKGDGVACMTTADATIGSDGKARVAVQASSTGASGNSVVAVQAALVSAPFGISSRVVVQPMTGGTDNESDSALLERLLDIIRRPPAGGNKYDYRRWALEVPGVSSAYVYPLRRGLGTVDVAITSGEALPSQAIIDRVQAHIDDVRPVTAKSSLVVSPSIRKVDFTLHVELDGITIEMAQQAISVAITDFVNRLSPGESLIRSQVEMMVSLTPGIKDRTLNDPAANVTAIVDSTHWEWLRPGIITVSLAQVTQP
jgi:uncharacterized phage protein gp47/JayE